MSWCDKQTAFKITSAVVVAIIMCFALALLIGGEFRNSKSESVLVLQQLVGIPTFRSTLPVAAGETEKEEKTKRPLTVAVLIETRTLPTLPALILQFTTLLGPNWPIRWYHNTQTQALAHLNSSNAVLRKLIAKKHITFHLLPEEFSFMQHSHLSRFLGNPWLWNDLAPYEKILMFQPDSIICARSDHHVDDFLEYDWIGAPVLGGQVFNGGLSLRSRKKMLEVITTYPYTEGLYEDHYFVDNLRKLNATLPNVTIAQQFAMESMWYETPMGIHQPRRSWAVGSDELNKLNRWCPEMNYILCWNQEWGINCSN